MTWLVLGGSSVVKRKTLCSCLSMTDRAVMLTFSVARAASTLASRPGLFSRNTVICFVVCMALPPRKLQHGSKRGQAPFAGTALRVLRTNGACPLFAALARSVRLSLRTRQLICLDYRPRKGD